MLHYVVSQHVFTELCFVGFECRRLVAIRTRRVVAQDVQVPVKIEAMWRKLHFWVWMPWRWPGGAGALRRQSCASFSVKIAQQNPHLKVSFFSLGFFGYL